jgi:general secretion pathway protein G
VLQKSKQNGFTIIELLIVIVVVGIVVALIINTVAGAQQRSRDTERRTDITTFASKLEVFYKEHGGYPQYGQFSNLQTAATMFPGLEENTLMAPGKTEFSIIPNASTNVNQYGYQAFADVAKTKPCDKNNECASFNLTYTKEALGSGETNPIVKNSLN